MDTSSDKLDAFLAACATAIADGTLVRAALRVPCGPDETLRSIDIKPVALKAGLRLAFTAHHRTRDTQHNHAPDAAIAELRAALGGSFRQGFLYTTEFDLLFDSQGKAPRLKRSAASSKSAAPLDHDRSKSRLIAAERPWLTALGVTDADGKVLKTAGDKFRQINRYVEILAPLLAAIPRERLRRIVDMGAGKGYLTFAVADYVARVLENDAEVVGVEFREDLTRLCNEVAAETGLGRLNFVPGSIDSFDSAGADVLIALHACDTATDDAISKGIAAGARLIVVAPCCHKQIRREMETANLATPLEFETRHGIFLERQAEMVTDAMRALILEHFGYAVKVFEFVSDLHTPKNVLIVAEKAKGRPDPAALGKLAAAKAFFGIRRHYLEAATGLT